MPVAAFVALAQNKNGLIFFQQLNFIFAVLYFLETMIHRFLPLFKKFMLFGIIGFISMILDFGITYLLKEKLKLNKYVANSLSFLVVGFINFSLNRTFTFTDHNADYNMQLIRFFAVSSTGLALNNLITYFFTEKRKYNFYFSKLLATFIVIFWNFTMNKMFTFKK